MAQSNNYNTPPISTDDVDYEEWKKEIKIWRMFTSLEKKNQAQDPLTGQASGAILELDPDTLPVDNGLESLIQALENLYLKDRD